MREMISVAALAAGPEPALPTLSLLGGFELVDVDGAVRELPTLKARLLLAYLALPAGQAHARGKLAGLLWEDRAEEQARGSLRNALSALRAAFADEAVVRADHETIALDPARIESDVGRLEALVKADGAGVGVAEALALTGVFLDGIEAPGGILDQWLAFERTRCRNLAQRLLTLVAQNLAGRRKRPNLASSSSRSIRCASRAIVW